MVLVAVFSLERVFGLLKQAGIMVLSPGFNSVSPSSHKSQH